MTTQPTDWREARAQDRELTARAIDDLLFRLEDIINALEYDQALVTEARSFAGLLRTRRDDLVSDARRLVTKES